METIEFSKLNGKLNIKEVKKKNNKKIFKYWRPIMFIMILKILQSFLKSFLFLFVSFSALKDESHISTFNNAFYKFLKPIKDTNRTTFFICSVILLILNFILLIPLEYGILSFFSDLTSDKDVKVTSIFRYYKNFKLFFRAIYFKFLMYFRVLIPTVLFLTPEIMLFVYSCIRMQTASEKEKTFLSLTVIISILILLVGIYFFIKFGPKNFVLPYIQAQRKVDNNLNVQKKENIKTLNKLTSSKSFNVFATFTSMLFLLQPLILPTFFVFPYFSIGVYSYIHNVDLLNL